MHKLIKQFKDTGVLPTVSDLKAVTNHGYRIPGTQITWFSDKQFNIDFKVASLDGVYLATLDISNSRLILINLNNGEVMLSIFEAHNDTVREYFCVLQGTANLTIFNIVVRFMMGAYDEYASAVIFQDGNIITDAPKESVERALRLRQGNRLAFAYQVTAPHLI